MENRKIIINHRTFRSLQRSSYRCTAVFLPLAAVTQPLAAVALPLFFSGLATASAVRLPLLFIKPYSII